MSYSYLFKFIAIGDSGVGKSSLLIQLTDKRFNAEHDLTIGVEFGTQTLTINNETVKLQIWDTAGQETFRSITRSYYRNTAAALLVYDMTQRSTFNNVSKWLSDVKSHGSEHITVILVGNKCDLEHLRQVSTEEGHTFAQENGLLFIETSAKTSKNVDESFTKPATLIYEQIKNGTLDPQDQSTGVMVGLHGLSHNEIHKSRQKKKSGCCSGGGNTYYDKHEQITIIEEKKDDYMDGNDMGYYNDDDTLSLKQRRFKEFVFKNSNFRESAQIYYRNMVENQCDELGVLLDFDETLLRDDFKMKPIHCKQFMRKIGQFKKDNKIFENWIDGIVKMNEYKDIVYQNGVMTFEIFYDQFKGYNDIMDIIGKQNEVDAKILWTKSPKIQRLAENQINNNYDNAQFAEEGGDNTPYI